MKSKARLSDRKLAEKFREKFCRDATERLARMEQDSLNVVFESLGDDAGIPTCLLVLQDEDTLATIRRKIDLGDRQAMIDRVLVVAKALRAFDVMPIKTRESLAHGLESTTMQLVKSGDFLPKKRGRKPAVPPTNLLVTHAFSIALQVELEKRTTGSKLEEAFEQVAQRSRLKDELVRKHWRLNHRAAKAVIEQIIAIKTFTAELLGK